jgi:hypothetical protein
MRSATAELSYRGAWIASTDNRLLACDAALPMAVVALVRPLLIDEAIYDRMVSQKT